MKTKYYVVCSSGNSTSLPDATEDVQRKVQTYLDKGGNLHGGCVNIRLV